MEKNALLCNNLCPDMYDQRTFAVKLQIQMSASTVSDHSQESP